MGAYKPEEEFMNHILEVDVDAARQLNRYTVSAMYEVVDEEGVAELDQRIVEVVTLTWKEINERGGVHVVNADFKARYQLE